MGPTSKGKKGSAREKEIGDGDKVEGERGGC